MGDRDDRLKALKWQIEAGADEAIGNAPVNRFAEKDPPPAAMTAPRATPSAAETPDTGPRRSAPSATAAAGPAATPTASSGTGAVSRSAYEIAAGASTLEDIRVALEGFEDCPLRQTATNLVYTDGNPDSRIVFVGEAPGAEEDRQGLPFVGPAGRLLDRMLAAIGLDRDHALITNTIFWRPPGNRNPSPAEVAACLPFVERTVEIVDPDVLVMVGGTAAKTLLARKEGIMKLRGRWFEFETARMVRPVPARAIFHPAYLLRSPGQKRLVWRDLIDIQKHLANGG